MAMDTLPRSILNEYNLFNIKVLFKKETTDGDTLHISSEVIYDENSYINTIHNITSDTGVLLTKLQIIWKKKWYRYIINKILFYIYYYNKTSKRL